MERKVNFFNLQPEWIIYKLEGRFNKFTQNILIFVNI